MLGYWQGTMALDHYTMSTEAAARRQVEKPSSSGALSQSLDSSARGGGVEGGKGCSLELLGSKGCNFDCTPWWVRPGHQAVLLVEVWQPGGEAAAMGQQHADVNAGSSQPQPRPRQHQGRRKHSESRWQPEVVQAPVQQDGLFMLAQHGYADTHGPAIFLPAASASQHVTKIVALKLEALKRPPGNCRHLLPLRVALDYHVSRFTVGQLAG
ncbi:hypothetical protein CVIRNUC_009120 [Coccomyxa viridis]|uniref:Uncharacterized protein n=1 Tax=Coccomyxa viridis TaxID=1274662 RepID=A0AAV1II69_9CHLO|nr:hypothetical protein CVIRNUC_009120 [Coccomyxa viridis]